MSRQVVLDTETTGINPKQGHRIIEIGCVEVINRRLTGQHYHQYLQPDREIEEGAIAVHGITNEFLQDKPRFVEVVEEFMAFIDGAELLIHNAPFDVGFIDSELGRLKKDNRWGDVTQHCKITDTLTMARRKHPGQKNNLDALCRRYAIDNSQRTLHGALLDAEILADVYLTMTGGQVSLLGGSQEDDMQQGVSAEKIRRLPADRPSLAVVRPTDEEQAAHQQRVAALDKALGGESLWHRYAN